MGGEVIETRIDLIISVLFHSFIFSFSRYLDEVMHRHVLSCVQLFETPWTVACPAPLSMEFSRQDYWSRLPFPTPGYLPYPGNKPASLSSPAVAGRFFTTVSPGKLLCARF